MGAVSMLRCERANSDGGVNQSQGLSWPHGSYEDSFADDHRLLCRYRGSDPRHRDNVGLREAMRRRTPLVYLFGLIPGRYLPIWPVFVVGDNPGQLCFTVMADDRQSISETLEQGAERRRTDPCCSMD